MKLLLATDQSESSTAALEAVLSQFPPKETCVRLFHAVDWEPLVPAPFLFAEGPNAAEALLKERDRIMRDLHARMLDTEQRFKAAGFAVDIEIEAGVDPVRAIVEAARAWRADLIVMGSHGRSGAHRLLLGSVAEGVLRHAPCAVQIVRPPLEPVGSLHERVRTAEGP